MTTNTSRVVGIPFFGSPERICEGAGQIFVGEKQDVGAPGGDKQGGGGGKNKKVSSLSLS